MPLTIVEAAVAVLSFSSLQQANAQTHNLTGNRNVTTSVPGTTNVEFRKQ